MSAVREVNWIGQQRVDMFHVRALDSSVAADFDCMAGMIYAGGMPLVVRGLTIPVSGTLGQPASNLVLRVADAVILHPTATDSGTIFFMPSAAADEPLSASNANVSGAFAASATNYVGIDLIREADASTSDLTKFIDPNTLDEIAKTVPVGRVMQLKISISTLPFSSTTNSLAVAKVVTDASANVISITDARNMVPRLGTGGDNPVATAAFPWPDTSRLENPITYSALSLLDPFGGGDKGIYGLKSTVAALQHVLWESKSGQSWYRPTTRDGVKLATGSTPVFGNLDNFVWTAGTSTLDWTGLSILFENSTGGFKNDIADGSAVIADGQCLYVDIDRTTSPTPTINMSIATNLQDVETPVIPGSRFILVWRNGPDIYIRDRPFDLLRLQAVLNVVVRRYPNIFVSSVVGEGDHTTLAAGVAALPVYGGVLVLQSDLTISSSVTMPANSKLLARSGVTLTLSGAGTELILDDRVTVQDLTISSTKTTGVLVRMSGDRSRLLSCRISINGAGTAIGAEAEGWANAITDTEFNGVIGPSTGVGYNIAISSSDFIDSGTNAFTI